MSHSIAYPKRIALACTPTPLTRLQRAGNQFGVDLLVKRDDLTGAPLSGNKIRKLEFLLADALEQNASHVLTCGGEQSNHCRATAIAATQIGLKSRLFLRTAEPQTPPPPTANILLDRLVGADIRWVSPAEYRERKTLFSQASEELRAAGHIPYVVPEGGSNALGSWGYVRCIEELISDFAAQGIDLQTDPVTLVYAAGSGGTGAGLILGKRLFGLDALRIVGVNVCDDRAYFVREIGSIVESAIDSWSLRVQFDRSEIEILDGYVGRGYAQSSPVELIELIQLSRSEGVLLDPVYTGKAFFGLASQLRKDRAQFGSRVVFLHTGGLFGLFPKSNELAPLL